MRKSVCRQWKHGTRIKFKFKFTIHSNSTFVEYINIFYSFQDMISSSIISEIVNPHRRWGSLCADSGRTAEFTRTAEVTRTADSGQTAEILSIAEVTYFIYLKLYNVQVTLFPRLLIRIGGEDVRVWMAETWDSVQLQISIHNPFN
jgi:hypothetical protein